MLLVVVVVNIVLVVVPVVAVATSGGAIKGWELVLVVAAHLVLLSPKQTNIFQHSTA